MKKITKNTIGAAIGALIGAIISLIINPNFEMHAFKILAIFSGAAIGGWMFNDIKQLILNIPEAFESIISFVKGCGRGIKKQVCTPSPLMLFVVIPLMVCAIMFGFLMDLSVILDHLAPPTYDDPVGVAMPLSFLLWILVIVLMMMYTGNTDEVTFYKTWAEFLDKVCAKNKKAVKVIGLFLIKDFWIGIFYVVVGILWCIGKLIVLSHSHERTLSAIDAVIAAIAWFYFMVHAGKVVVMNPSAVILSLIFAASIGAVIGRVHYQIKELVRKIALDLCQNTA